MSLPDDTARGLLVANLLAQLAFGLLAMMICIPSMQQWGATFGASQAAVQLTFSGFVVAFGSVQLLYGPLSDRLGRKRVLLAGLALAAAGSVAAALASDVLALTAARVLQGAGAGAGMVIGRALVQDHFHGAERTRVMAYVGMVMGLCPPAATIVGGQVHVLWGWQANFVGIAVLAALLWLAAWRGLPDSRPAAAPSHWLRAMAGAYARLAREPVFVLYVLVLASTTATFYAFLGGAPIVLGGYGIGPDGIGFYVMAIPLSYIAGNYLTSRIAHRAGERTVMRLGQALTIGGLLLVLALAGLRTPLALALPLVLVGVGHGLLMPPSLAGTVGVVPARRARADAARRSAPHVRPHVDAHALTLRCDREARRRQRLDQPHRGARMLAQRRRPEHRRRAGEREEDEHLVGRVRVQRRARFEVAAQRQRRLPAEMFGGHAALRHLRRAEHGGPGRRAEHDRTAGPQGEQRIAGFDVRVERPRAPDHATRRGGHAPRDVQRQAADVRVRVDRGHGPALVDDERCQRPGRRQRQAHLAAAARHVAAALDLQLSVHAHAREQRQQHQAQVIDRRRHRHVGAAAQHDLDGLAAGQRGRQHRLQHERDAAGGADVDDEAAAVQRAGPKREHRRAGMHAIAARVAQRSHRAHRRHVLRRQPRAATPRADVVHAHYGAGDCGQRDRGAHELAAALAVRAVDVEHRRHAHRARPRVPAGGSRLTR
nr:MFS transporter [Azohydromonas sediminis]